MPLIRPQIFKPVAGLRFLALVLVLGAGAAVRADGPVAAVFPADPGLTDYLAWAEDHHPAMARAAGREAALRHGARSAGALPDLKFGWGEMIVPVETRVGPQQRVFSLSQSIPWFGTLGLQEKVAATRADAAAQDLLGQRLAVHHGVRAAWYELANLQGEITIITDNVGLAHQAEAASRSAYEAGAGSFGDVLAAQIDVEKLAAQLAGLKDRLNPARTQLNMAAGLPADHPAPTVRLPGFADDLPARETLWAMLEQNNPELGALRLERDSRRQGVDLAGKAGYPDLTLGLDYIMTGPARLEGMPDSGKDPVIARLGVSIPLWGGRAGAEKQASAGRLASASAELADARQRLNARLETVLYRWREARRNRDLYGSVLLSSGRQAFAVTAARYRSGQASYVDLVTARKTLLGLELANLRATVELAQSRNDLATLVGATADQLPLATRPDDPGRRPEPTGRKADGKHE